MTPVSKALPRGLHVLLTIALIVTAAWATVELLCLLILTVDPMNPLRRFLTITTLYPLLAGREAGAALVTADAPPGTVSIDLLAYVTFRPRTSGFILATAAGVAAWWGLWITALVMLRRIVGTLGDGKPFQVPNIGRIRVAGWAVIGVALFEPLWEFVMLACIKLVVTLHGVSPFPPLPFIVESLPVGTFLAGLVVLAVAEVFRLGVALEDEQALTV